LTRLVEIEFPDDAEKVRRMLEKNTGMQFVTSYSVKERVNHIEPVETWDRVGTTLRFRFGKPLTEDELKKLDPATYEYYIWLKQHRERTQAPRRNYYVVVWGETVLGSLTPRRGRITSRDKAMAALTGAIMSALWNYYHGGYTRGVWEPIKLLYYRHEEDEPENVVSLQTPEEALEFVGRDEFEAHVAENLRRLRSR
jgi:hypothetical protein